MVDPETDLFVAEMLFATITNANFDPDRYVVWIREAVTRRDALRAKAQARCGQLHGADACGSGLPEHAMWVPKSYDVRLLDMKGQLVGAMATPELDADIRSLRELIVYGLKGMAAYTEHAYVLEHTNDDILAFVEEALDATTDDGLSAEALGWPGPSDRRDGCRGDAPAR